MLLRFTKLWDEINPFSEEIVGQTGYVRGGPRISSCEYAACACLRARHCPDTCMPARTALPRHMYACAHGTAPAHTRAHARRTMCPASAKQALAVADRRLRATGQSTGCPTRSCSHLREAKCGTQRTRTRTITAPTVHGRTAHAPILAEIVHAVTAAPTAQNACVRTTL